MSLPDPIASLSEMIEDNNKQFDHLIERAKNNGYIIGKLDMLGWVVRRLKNIISDKLIEGFLDEIKDEHRELREKVLATIQNEEV